jgi:hypothetical protein
LPGWRVRPPANSSSRSTVNTAAALAPPLADQFVHIDGCGTQQFDDPAAHPICLPLDRDVVLHRRLGLAVGLAEVLAEDGVQSSKHIGGAFGEHGAFADKAVSALGARIERRAGHRENLWTLLERVPADLNRDSRGRGKGGVLAK